MWMPVGSLVWWPDRFEALMFLCSNGASGQDTCLLALPQFREEGNEARGREKEEREKDLFLPLSLDFYLLGKEIQF